MLDAARTAIAVARSLGIYYGSRRRTRAMEALYRGLLSAPSIVFDLGCHVGDRVACFRRLGARVLAVEPQPAFARTVEYLYRRDAGVTVLHAAVGAAEGEVELAVNVSNPTVSSTSPAFVAAASAGASGWVGQRWPRRLRVRQLTLDELIRRHGCPDFVKIDVEGAEAAVLSRLSVPLAALSFEFTTIQRQVAIECLDHCDRLGRYGFNAALGETQRLVHARWLDAQAMADWLQALPHEANSGDIYASREGEPRPPAPGHG